MNQRLLMTIIILAGIGSIGSVLAYTGTISAGQGNFNNLLVTGTCSGCGAGEGSFTSYSTVLNSTISGTNGWNAENMRTANDGTTMFLNGNNQATIVFVNGTVLKQIGSLSSTSTVSGIEYIDQSLTGEYKVLLNDPSSILPVYKNNILIQNIGFNISQFLTGPGDNFAISVSPNGKYISLHGIDSGGAADRLVIFQGS